MVRKTTKFFLGVLIFIAFVVWSAVLRAPDQGLKVTVFDVGQGDAILIKSAEDKNILIDGGPDNQFLSALGDELPYFNHQIEAIILTHPHADHLFGLIEILKRYQVKKIYLTGVVHTSSLYLEFLNLIKEKNIETEVLIRGDELNFGDLRLVALWPERDLTGESVDDLNSTSIVLKLSSAEFQALLLADIDRESQQVMLNRGDFNDFSDIDLLKIAHHGSGENYNQNLIDKVRPKQAIISVGEDNRYGHPAKSVVDDLLRREIELFRTDRDGSVSFTTNGASLSR